MILVFQVLHQIANHIYRKQFYCNMVCSILFNSKDSINTTALRKFDLTMFPTFNSMD